ncbi:Restriction alleviation protein Lar [Hathewaya proteolytica DSM 3090]|uniref:Restriction alleviation protein Lar n=1 Tax=Hathewaya proteolytica DSM 3090 TaxID=1121331 RepID=A0A1M6S2C1_9CLOT|nr:Lar family restriction alleviation protein [Hathewaya proteolytica]SHK38811.1 Restriction alleviation protein Lar [Hathewaya proteolytica DSM 3090]
MTLKNCPFCGGKMEPEVMCFQKAYEEDYQKWLNENNKLPSVATGYNTGWIVRCYHCGAKSKEGLTKEEVAEAWNRREKREDNR